MAETGKIGKIPLLGSRNEGFAEFHLIITGTQDDSL
jgi:hypothetical protein